MYVNETLNIKLAEGRKQKIKAKTILKEHQRVQLICLLKRFLEYKEIDSESVTAKKKKQEKQIALMGLLIKDNLLKDFGYLGKQIDSESFVQIGRQE